MKSNAIPSSTSRALGKLRGRFTEAIQVRARWALALIIILAALSAGAATSLYLIDGPGVQLDGAWLPRAVLLPTLVIAVAVIAIGGARSGAAWFAPSEPWFGQSWRSRARATVVLSLSLLLALGSGAAITALSVLNYAPVSGDRQYILADSADELGESSKRRIWMLRVLAKEFHAAEASNLQIEIAQAGLRSVLERAVEAGVHSIEGEDASFERNPTVASLANELISVIEVAGTERSTDEWLRGIASGIRGEVEGVAGRLGDCVVVVSGHRGPPVGIEWPVQPGLTTCRWLTPPIAGDEATADDARVLSLTVLDDVAVASMFSMTLEAPASIGWPTVRLQLCDESGSVLHEQTIVPPDGAEPARAPTDVLSFGRDGDRLAYRALLPRLGASLKVRFSGPGWDDAISRVPELRGSGIRLGARRVDAIAAPDLAAWLDQVLPASGELRSIATAAQSSYGKPGGVRLAVVAESESLPEMGPVLQIIRFTAAEGSAAALRHTHRWIEGSLRQVRLDRDATADWPLRGQVPQGVVPLIEAEVLGGPPQPVLYDHPGRPDAITVVLPHNPEGRHSGAVGQLLVFGASLAIRGGSNRPLLFSRRASSASPPRSQKRR